MNAYPAALRPALRTFVVALVATLAVFGLTAITAPAQAASSSILSMSSSTYESQVQYYVNRKRAARGLPKLRLESCTDSSAERWAQYLASSGQFFHQSMMDIIRRCDAYYAGETLGRGAISPKTLVTMWMNSPAHKSVLLSRHARRIGVGAYVSGGQWVTAANFTKF
ncbi:MAG TPA: CAP domain-containing protein [Nocardioides sp.]|nr:CAP domain-containing protein [Nocardioides sp.]